MSSQCCCSTPHNTDPLLNVSQYWPPIEETISEHNDKVWKISPLR